MREKRSYTRLQDRIKEKRRFVRVPAGDDKAIEVQIIGDVFLEVLNAKDISTNGVSVYVPHEFRGCNINDEVDLILTLSNEEPFNAKGIIIHSSSSSRGYFSVEFTGITSENKNLIYNYIHTRLHN
ncbi:MAG: PilZ domain-containing protein [Candidatus Brocadiales bacterium]|nr:PilZ domain-containing protein [Candidatus Brocadiales bacterium]